MDQGNWKPLPGTLPGSAGWDPMQFDQQVSCDNRMTSKEEPRETAAYEARERELATRLGMPLYLVGEMKLAGPRGSLETLEKK